MYSQLIYMSPKPSKIPDLLKELKERNAISNGEGFPHMVAQQMFRREPTVLSVTQFENLGALERWYDENATQQSFRESGARILETVTRPTSLELAESLAQSERTGDVKYFLSATSFAAPGKAGELRQALEKSFSNTPTKGTVMRVLQREIAPEDGGNCTLNFGFSSLTGLEELMHEPGFGAGGAVIGNLLNRPIRQRLFRVLMPFIRS